VFDDCERLLAENASDYGPPGLVATASCAGVQES
jgi:hypothetical protein